MIYLFSLDDETAGVFKLFLPAFDDYGDYLREAGYAVKKTGAVEWRNYSDKA